MIETPLLPPVVYLACTAPAGTAIGEADWGVRLAGTDDGRFAILAYTALDRLVDACGPHQPWVLMPAARLDELDEHCPFDVILLDTPLADDERCQGGPA
jgi:hypothetical protein